MNPVYPTGEDARRGRSPGGESLSGWNRLREGETVKADSKPLGSKKLPGQKHTTGGLTFPDA